MFQIRVIPVKCAISGCGNTPLTKGRSVEYHPFPVQNEDLLAIWMMKCGGEEDIDPHDSFVCSDHFSSKDYIESGESQMPSLRPSAYPNRNLGPLFSLLDETEESLREEPNIIDEICNRDECKVIVVPNFNASGLMTQTENDSEGPCSSETTDNSWQGKKGRGFCRVVTCKARVMPGDTGFHTLPLIDEAAALWEKTAFLRYSGTQKNKQILCRRHFLASDYCQPPAPGRPARLRRGAVPSQNLPANLAVVKLACAKLKQDLIIRKKEYKDSSLEKQFSDVPELSAAFEDYKSEMRRMGAVDPIPLPVMRRRGELQGPGEPVPSGPYVKPKIRKTKVRTLEEERMIRENRRQLALRKRLQTRQLVLELTTCSVQWTISRHLTKRRMPISHRPLQIHHADNTHQSDSVPEKMSKTSCATTEILENSPENFVDHCYIGSSNPMTSENSVDSTLGTSTSVTTTLLPVVFDSLADDLKAMPEFDARVKVRDLMNRFRAEFKKRSLDIRTALLDVHRMTRKLAYMKLNLANAIAAEFESLYGPLP